MIIKLKQGLLKGKICESILNGTNFYGFFGIPYAKPPVGQLRFQEPQPHDGWEGILDATKPGNDCVQVDFMANHLHGHEDCLFLNVYTPHDTQIATNPKPVMVLIHGGGFELGSGRDDFYGPDYLINYDVVIVAMNYRVHALGFLNLGIPECPGNVGMKDQVLALKWVKDNIKSFGGDDGNITLFGVSAGAASTHYHMISPLSKGLFNRCILQSGTSLCSWSFLREPEKMAYKLGKELGYQGPQDAKELLAFLKKVDANDIAKAVNKFFTSNVDPLSLGFHFVPSLEKIKEGAFLPDEPEALVKFAEPFPVIVGITEKEFLSFQIMMKVFEIGNLDAKTHMHSIVNRVMDDFKLNKKYHAEVAEKITNFYFGNAITKDVIDMKTTDLFSDLTFGISLYRSVENVLRSRYPVYVYLFTFLGALNFSNILEPKMKHQYTSHGGDMGYIFHCPYFKMDKELIRKEPEKTVIKNICKLWTNFAKTGNPNGSNVNADWVPSTIEKPTYIEINSTLIKKEGRIDDDRVTFWENIIRDYKVV